MDINLGKHQEKNHGNKKLIKEKIEALDVYWYDTFNDQNMDIPGFVEAIIMQRFFDLQGRLPRWNKEF